MGQVGYRAWLFTIALLVFVSGCFEPETRQLSAPEGVLRIGLTNPIYHVKLHSQGDVNFWQVQSLMYESLLRRDPKTGELEPRLAESYRWSADKKSLEFVLRDGLKWSDGQPLSAWDVEFTIRSHGDENFKSMYFGVYDARIKGIRVKDDRKFSIDFQTRSPSNLKAVALNLLIYPRFHFEGSAKAPAKFPPTSGAFMFESFEPGKKLVLLKNPEWAFSRPGLWSGIKSLEYRWYEGQRQQLDAATNGEIDFFEVANPAEFVKAEQALKRLSHWSSVKAEGYRLRGRHTLVLNHKNKALRSLKVRESLLALSRRSLLNTKLYHGMLELAVGPWPADHPAGVEVKGVSNQPANETASLNNANKATVAEESIAQSELVSASAVKAVLGEAGWFDSDKDGVLDQGEGSSPLELRVISFDRQFEPFLTLLQEQARSAGVKVVIERQDFLEAMKSFEGGGADAVYIYSSWLPYELNLKSWYESEDDGNPWTNPGHFQDAKLKELIRLAESEFDETKRLRILKKAFRRLSQLKPDLYLFNDKYKLYFVQDRVTRPQGTLGYSLGMESWSM